MPDLNQIKNLSRASLEVARRSMEKGNLPFGCILADKSGNIIEEGENTVLIFPGHHCSLRNKPDSQTGWKI